MNKLQQLLTLAELIGNDETPKTADQTNETNGAIRIVVLQRGWVYVGRYHRTGDECTLTNASCIRTWGTTNGLGQLVNGPTEITKLDKAGTVRFHIAAQVNTLDCVEEKWSSHL